MAALAWLRFLGFAGSPTVEAGELLGDFTLSEVLAGEMVILEALTGELELSPELVYA